VADAMEAPGQYVHQEPADELVPLLPGAGQKLQNLHSAVVRCRRLIVQSKNVRKFPGALWKAEAKKWPAYRSQVDRGLLQCREFGLSGQDLSYTGIWVTTFD
jgi:hypothetical protein